MVANKLHLDPTNRRASPRFDYQEVCTLTLTNRRMRGTTYNISTNGLAVQIQGLGRIDIGDILRLRLQDFPAIRARVCWTKGRKVGFQFDEPLDRHPELRALLDRLENGEPAWPSTEEAQKAESHIVIEAHDDTFAKAVANATKSIAHATDRSDEK